MPQPPASRHRGQRNYAPPIHDFLEWMRNNILYADTGAEEKRYSFVPVGEAKKYLAANHHSVLDDILYELFGHLEPPVDSETILSNYVAMFCILVDMNEGAAIADFVRHDHNDQRLPFDIKHEPPGLPPDTSGDFFPRFCERQWRFCVPTFQKNMARHFEKERILPISKMQCLASGGSATIQKIKLHGDYDKLLTGLSTADPNDLLHIFALKTYLHPDASTYYECEVSAFRRLNHSANPHLIGFYGNYRQGDTYNIILEYADEGSLEQYFEITEPPSEEEDIINFWTSLFDIIKALASIENTTRNTTADVKIMNGWHQDVKPANILVLSNRAASRYEYRFKLADLGLSHFKMTVEGIKPGPADDAYGTQTYGAPECFRDDKFWDRISLNVTQGVDIWSFGCVLSEAAVWICKGYSGVVKYRQGRILSTESISSRLGDCFHDGQHVLPIVQEWHASLQNAIRHCDRITPGVLHIIEKDMLQDPGIRLNTKQLWGRAQALLGRSRNATLATSMHHVVVEQNIIRGSSGSLRGRRNTQESPHNQRLSLTPQRSPPLPAPINRIERNSKYRNSNSAMTPPTFSDRHRVSEPETVSIVGGSGIVERNYAPSGKGSNASMRRNHRQMSQPQPDAARPNVPPLVSDNHLTCPNQGRVSEESSLSEDLPDQREWDTSDVMNDGKGKGLMRRTGDVPTPILTGPNQYAMRTIHEKPKQTMRYPPVDEEERGPIGSSRGFSTSSAPNNVSSQQRQRDTPSRHDPGSGSNWYSEEPSSVDSREPSPSSEPRARHPRKRQSATHKPWLSLSVALEWRRLKKENSRAINWLRQRQVPKLPDDYLLGKVSKRDHVFIIDDSGSMRLHWDEMCQLFDILAYMVKEGDDDGIDVYFTMAPTGTGYKNQKNTSDLVDIVKKRKDQLEGVSNINDRLDAVLMEYIRDLNTQVNLRKSGARAAPKDDKRPLTVYVFTDGVWTKRSNPKPAITKVVSSLTTLGYPANQVGIQFISFGRDGKALKRLEEYDSGLGLELDIVDHTPSSHGNLWKMILGAINADFDDDSDGEAPHENPEE